MTKRTTKTKRTSTSRERKPENVAIGKRIRELRNASPQTNKSIAATCGIGERAVAEWVRGGGISFDNAECVAEIFGVRVQWLLTGEGPRNGQTNGQVEQRLSSLEDAVRELAALIRQQLVQDLEADEDAAVRRSRPSGKRTSARGRATRKK